MYDDLCKERMEKAAHETPRTLRRLDQKTKHLEEMVRLFSDKFAMMIQEKIRILDEIYSIAMPRKNNPLASLSQLGKPNNEFLNSIKPDQNVYQAKINTMGMSGGLSQRVQYLKIMHKSMSLFAHLIVKKVSDQQQQHNQNMLRLFTPRQCVRPASLDFSMTVENFELDHNYFGRSLARKRKTQMPSLQT